MPEDLGPDLLEDVRGREGPENAAKFVLGEPGMGLKLVERGLSVKRDAGDDPKIDGGDERRNGCIRVDDVKVVERRSADETSNLGCQVNYLMAHSGDLSGS